MMALIEPGPGKLMQAFIDCYGLPADSRKIVVVMEMDCPVVVTAERDATGEETKKLIRMLKCEAI